MKRLLIFALLSLFSLATYADCPEPSQVTYICGGGHCAWSAPWYEGFRDETAAPGDTATSLNHVFWGNTENSIKPLSLGSTNCFYDTPKRQIIGLAQNSFGNVPLPTQGPWMNGNWGDKKGLICKPNAGSCHFNYKN